MQHPFDQLSSIDDYDLLGPIGAGGQCVVYKARHRTMKRVVAIKSLLERSVNDPIARRLFAVEIEVSAMLTHPHILRAYDAREYRGIPYLIMELHDGADLAALSRGRSLPVDSAVSFVLQAAKGLAFAHARGIVHRDIKPSNLFVTRDNSLLVFDWGLAKCPHLSDPATMSGAVAADAPFNALRTGQPVQRPVEVEAPLESRHVTRMWDQLGSLNALETMAAQVDPIPDESLNCSLIPAQKFLTNSWTGHIVGTPAFMAPEQMETSDVDQRADIYALGATLYFLLTGQAMYTGNLLEIRGRKRSGYIPSLGDAVPGATGDLESVYRSMVQVNPADRLQSMDEAIQALASIQRKSKVFISYRREDSIDATDRIYEGLASRFGAGRVFMDIDTIPPGTDYRSYLHGAISESAVMLVIIGQHWTSAARRGLIFSRRRLWDPEDWVRIEIELAIEQGVQIIPVLVGQTELPKASELPQSLRQLLNFQIIEVRPGRHYADHIANLIKTIERYVST